MVRRSCSLMASGVIRICGDWLKPDLQRVSGWSCSIMSAAAHRTPSAWDPKRYESLQGYADDILGIVRELDLRDVTYVGHSVAAMMGVLAVATDPSPFARLVLLTPSPCYIDKGDYRGGFTRADIDEFWTHSRATTLGGRDRWRR